MNRGAYILITCAILYCAWLTGCIRSEKIDDYIKQAEDLKGMGQFEEAIATYKKALEKYSNDPKAPLIYLKMGDLYFNLLNDQKNGISAYEAVVKNAPLSSEAKDAMLRLADIFEKQGYYERAIENYSYVIRYFPKYEGRPLIMLKIGEAYLMLQNLEQANIELKKILETKDNVPKEILAKTYFDLGEIAFMLKRYKEAFDYYKEIDQKFQDSPFVLDARLKIVECSMEMGAQPDFIVSLLSRLSEMYPKNEKVEKMKGLLLKSSGTSNSKTSLPKKNQR